MKKILFLIVVIFSIPSSFSQNWIENLPKDKTQQELTLFDYQNAFKQYEEEHNAKNGIYLENGIETKLAGYKQFKRWEWYWEQRVDPLTGKFPEKTDWEVLQEHKNQNPEMYSSVNGNWEIITPNETSNWANNSGLGRVSSIGFHPTNPNIFFVGSNSGGLWKTTDGGQTYINLTDNLGYESIRKIYIPNDFSTTNTFYILVGNLYSTSNDKFQEFHSRIFKTTDGGQTWNGLSIGYDYPVYNPPYTTARILNRTDLQFDPNDSNIIYVRLLYSYSDYTQYNGWYTSNNGGETWSALNHHIGSVFHPTNSNIQYDYYNGFIKTTDGGNTWSGIVPPTDNSIANQYHIAVSLDQPDVVYLLTGHVWNSGVATLEKSTDAGETFTTLVDSNSGFPYLYKTCSGSITQASGNGALTVNPYNADEVYAGGFTTYRSEDGGSTWTCGFNSHVDKHFYGFQPITGDFFEGNDGGVAKIESGQSTSINLSKGLQISQIYRIGTSKTNPNEYLFGTQDNGTFYHSSNTNDWKKVSGSDGMDCAIDPNNENIQYSSAQGAIFFLKTPNKWQSSTNIRNNFPSGFNGYWVTPLKLSPNNSNVFYVLGNGSNNMLIKTIDGGNNFSIIGNGGRTFDVASTNENIIYIGNSGGSSTESLLKTIDGGNTWIELIDNFNEQYGPYIHEVSINPNNPDIVAVASRGTPGIFLTIDGGVSWQDISEGLPNNRINKIVYNKLITNEIEMYIGTNGGGIYVKRGNTNWIPFMSGLSSAPITDLEIYYDTNNPENSKIRAGTYGRGLWESDLYTPDTESPVAICQNLTIQLDINGNATIQATDIDNGSTDNIGITSYSLNIDVFTCEDIGENTVILTVTDDAGNTDTCSATVTVEDNLPPIAITQDSTVQLDANGNVTIEPSIIDNGSNDNCDLTLSLNQDTFTCDEIGENTVTLTVTDTSGNSDTETAIVTVEDIMPPNVITQDITVQLDASGNATITATDIDNGSTDNCGIASSSLDITNFTCNDIGINTVTLSVLDVNGNTGTGTATVTVEDNLPPIAITQDATVQLDANGNVTIEPSIIDNGSNDNCDLTLSLNQDTFSCDDLGSNTVTLTVTDPSGNSDSETATLIVEDILPPTAITQDATVQLDANGIVTIGTSIIDNGSNDNCDLTLTLDQDTFICDDLGENTITLTVTDSSGNSDSDTAILTVEDIIDPEAIGQDITIDLIDANPYVITPSDVDNGSTDNCAFSLSLDIDTFTAIGVYSVVLTATDDSGNTDTTTVEVTVIDTTLGVINNDISMFSMYPNPANQNVIIKANEIIYTITIFDVSGQRIFHKSINAMDCELSISYFSNGVYFVKAKTNTSTIIKKLIKE